MAENRHVLLVVDDDRLNLDMLSRRLERHGYIVVQATGGQRALQTLRTRAVDLVLLDHQMPDMTGLDVLRRVRRKHTAGDLPVIMVTAANDTNTVLGAASFGANDFITKPIDMARLLARLRLYLDEGGRRQASPAAS